MDLGGITNNMLTSGSQSTCGTQVLKGASDSLSIFGSNSSESGSQSGSIFDILNPIKLSKKLPGGNSFILNPVGNIASKIGNLVSKIPLVGGLLGNLLGADQTEES